MTYLLAISSLLSRLLGVYRNHALAAMFGASAVSDAYFAAFQVPDTIYLLLVFGAVSASFVPLYLKLNKENPQEAQDFVSSVMNGFLLAVALLCLVVFVIADHFVSWLYPLFPAEVQQQTTELLRIMLLSPLFFTCSSIFAGLQNAARTFWGFALAPILYNAGIISGIVLLAPHFGIYGVAYGVVLGSMAHAGIQFIPALKLGFAWKPVLHWSESFKVLIKTAIPRILSMAGFQVNFFIEGIIATTLLAGNLTVLRYAQDIQSFPIGIIGVSVAISSFSLLSNMVIDGKLKQLSRYIYNKLEHLLLVMIPAATGLFVLREPVVQLVLKSGIFGAEAASTAALTVAYLCIGIVAAALTPFVNRVFFSFHDTIRPFVVMAFTVVINGFLAYNLASRMGVSGIGLSSALTSTFSLVVLLILLKTSYLKGQKFFPLKSSLISGVGAFVMAIILLEIAKAFTYSGFTVILLSQMIMMAALGVIIYFAVLFLFFRRRLFHLVATFGE